VQNFELIKTFEKQLMRPKLINQFEILLTYKLSLIFLLIFVCLILNSSWSNHICLTLNYSWSNLVCLHFGIIKNLYTQKLCIHTFTFGNEYLKMKYFPSSLTKNSFTWLKTLPPNSIYNWQFLVDLIISLNSSNTYNTSHRNWLLV